MSRIGKRILTIPENVNVELNEQKLTVKGPKGELSLTIVPEIKVNINEKEITVEKLNNSKHTNEMQGTTNANINNMLIGVSNGFSKSLEAVGVGYRFNVQGNKIVINAGYSNPVEVLVPSDLSVSQESNTEITIHGIDKQKVSEFAANVRKVRKPEPYKGKGIRYKGEHIRRKEGKKAA